LAAARPKIKLHQILALAANFKIVVNICHLISYYFLELLPIFVILNTSLVGADTEIKFK